MIETYENVEEGVAVEVSQDHRTKDGDVYVSIEDTESSDAIEMYIPVHTFKSLVKLFIRADNQLRIPPR